MMDDVRYAFRQLRTHPAFAVVAVATLAVGIGAAAAMFGLIQGVLLSPPPYAQPDRLVLVTPVRIDGQPYDRAPTIGQAIAWRGARSLERTALYRWTFNFLVRGDGSRSLGGMNVSRDWFDVVGVKPLLGRTFTANEAGRPGVAPTAIILGYDLWQREFGGDPADHRQAGHAQPDAGTAAGRRRDAARPPLPARSRRRRRTELRPRRQGRLLPRRDAGRVAARARRRQRHRAPRHGRDRRRRAGGAGGDVRRHRRRRRTPRRPHHQRQPGPLGPQPRRRAAARPAVRRRRPAVPHRLRQRQRPAGGARPAAPAGVRHPRRHRRRARPALPAGADRSGGHRPDRRRARRRRRLRHRRGPQEHRRSRGAAGGRRRRRLAGAPLRGPGGAHGRHRRRSAARHPRLVGRSVRAAQGIADDGGPGRAAAAGRRRRRPGRAHRLAAGRRRAAAAHRPQPRSASTRATRPSASWRRRSRTSAPRDQTRAFHDQALERVAAIPGVRHAAFAWGVPLTGNSWPAEIEVPGRAAASVGHRRSHQPAAAGGDRGLLRGDEHAPRWTAGCSCRPTTKARRGSSSSTRPSSASISATAWPWAGSCARRATTSRSPSSA